MASPHEISFLSPDYAISKPDLMSQMERGERPSMQEQEDSEEGGPPADPSAGEWLPSRSQGCTLERTLQRARVDYCVSELAGTFWFHCLGKSSP